MSGQDVMNPEMPYQITTLLPTDNPILLKWYGEQDYMILDGDYTNYAIVYSCTKK